MKEMNPEKKIIQIDKVKPGITKEKRLRRHFAAGGFLLLALGAALFLWIAAKPDILSIKNYEKDTVRAGTFISTTEASGTVVLPTQVEIVSPMDAYAGELLAAEGDQVTPLDVLAVLDVPDLEDELDDLTLSYKQALIEQESLEKIAAFNIDSLERSVRRLEDDVKEAQDDADSMKALAELKSSRQSSYETALDTLEDYTEQLEDTRAELEEALVSSDIDLRKQQAVIDQLQTSIAAVQADIEENRIKSPISGEVLSLNESLAIKSSLVEQSDSLFVVADRGDVYIDFDVYEQYAGLLETGGTMTVTIGTGTMKAEITKIGKIATMDTDGLSAMITVRARPDTDLTLTPGASAVASIVLDVKDGVLTLPRGSWLTTGNQKYAYVIDGNRAVKTKVTIGDIQGNSVEILSGLKAGDQVITGSYQNYIDQDEVLLK